MIRIGVLTCPRDGGAYPLPRMLGSMISTDSTVQHAAVRVFAETPLGHVPKFFEVDQFGEQSIKNPLARALWWCANGGELALTLEDDVTFSYNWLRRAIGLFQSLEPTRQAPVVLSLHDMCTAEQLRAAYEQADRWCDVEAWCATDKAWPNGSQGLMMRASTALQMAGRIAVRYEPEKTPEGHAWMFDVDVLKAARELGAFFVCDPCLLMHMHDAPSTWWPSREKLPEYFGCNMTKRFRPW